MTHRVRRIAVLQSAKICGLLYAILGILYAPVFALSLLADPVTSDGAITEALLFPVVMALVGFLMAALTVWIYNFASAWLGGVEIELEPVVPRATE